MQTQLTVAPARWWHVPGLSRLIRETRRTRTAAGGEGALVWAPRWSPSLGLLQSVWASPVAVMPGPRSFVAEEAHRPVGLAQIRPRREPQQWDVAYFAVEPPPASANGTAGNGQDGAAARVRHVPDRRAARLLGGLCDAGVQVGAERLLARIAEDGPAYDIFRQLGFTPVVREYTYFRRPADGADGADGLEGVSAAPPPPPPIEGLRPQRRADAFGVLQLYQECTPKVVQMAEGKRSASWELPVDGLGHRLTRRSRVLRWVVERDARKVAWVQLHIQRRGPHVLRMMVDERTPDLAQPLVEFALAALEGETHHGVIVRVREHQQRLLAALEACEFVPVDGQLLMVKQLAAPVVQRQFAGVLEKVV